MRESILSVSAFSDQTWLVKRLVVEFIEAISELRANPREYLASAIRGDAFGVGRRSALFRFGLAISILLYTTFFAVTLVLWSVNAHRDVVEKDISVIYPPPTWLPPSHKEGRGGGGGGDEAEIPASKGAPPPFSAENPIIAPTTRPTIEPPSLLEIERLLGDPAQNLKRDELIPAGLPTGVPGALSDGPGISGGIGTGGNGGVGPGEGPGFGPGKKGGQGGQDYNGPGGKPGSDVVTVVDTKPIALNSPRPNYSEEARLNKIQGTVRVRVLVSVDGVVKQVTIVRGLPDGLNEEAIRAVFQLRFRPAIKAGRPVSCWTTVEVDFNLR